MDPAGASPRRTSGDSSCVPRPCTATSHRQESFSSGRDPLFHEMSHGESFLRSCGLASTLRALYRLDEPEAALSFSAPDRYGGSCTTWPPGGQVLCATHSCQSMALPGARILEVGPWGVRETDWEELELVTHWRRYLEEPLRYLRHVIDTDWTRATGHHVGSWSTAGDRGGVTEDRHGGDRGRSAARRRVERSYQVYVRGRLKFRVKQMVYVAFSLDQTVMGFAFPGGARGACRKRPAQVPDAVSVGHALQLGPRRPGGPGPDRGPRARRRPWRLVVPKKLSPRLRSQSSRRPDSVH